MSKAIFFIKGEFKRCTESHGFLQCFDAKFDHDRVGITVNDVRVVRVPVLLRVLGLDLALRRFNHLSAERRRALRDLDAGQFSDRRARETVHRVGTDLSFLKRKINF